MCVTTIRNTNLPDFARPPIVETALSVQFQRLEQLAIRHFGVFWQSIRRVYPRFQVHPPLNQVFERFGEQSVSSPQVSIEELRGYPETFSHCCGEITQPPCGNETQGDRRERVCSA